MSAVSDLLNSISIDERYYLMNKDRPIFEFKFTGDNSIQIKDIFEKPPFWIKDLQEWLSYRSAAKYRSDVKDLLERNNALTIRGFVLFTQCLSLTDTLWVKRVNSNSTWDLVNLYDNQFNESIGVAASDDDFGITVPTLSTDGSFAKCWKWFKDGSVLIKRGRTDYEPYAEVFASKLKLPNIQVIDYTVVRSQYYVESVCLNIASKDVSILPYIAVSQGLSLQETSDYYESIGQLQAFNNMLLHDAVTLNVDRHNRNFGILINSDTYEVLSMCPLYDFNMCYGCDRMYMLRVPIEQLAEQSSRRFGPFLDSINGRLSEESVYMVERSLNQLMCEGIPECEDWLFERMISITKMQLDKIKRLL